MRKPRKVDKPAKSPMPRRVTRKVTAEPGGLVDKRVIVPEPEDWHTFILYALNGLHVPKIAKVQNVSVSTIERRIRRVREHLSSTGTVEQARQALVDMVPASINTIRVHLEAFSLPAAIKVLEQVRVFSKDGAAEPGAHLMSRPDIELIREVIDIAKSSGQYELIRELLRDLGSVEPTESGETPSLPEPG